LEWEAEGEMEGGGRRAAGREGKVEGGKRVVEF